MFCWRLAIELTVARLLSTDRPKDFINTVRGNLIFQPQRYSSQLQRLLSDVLFIGPKRLLARFVIVCLSPSIAASLEDLLFILPPSRVGLFRQHCHIRYFQQSGHVTSK